jgi:hypothetical protein
MDLLRQSLVSQYHDMHKEAYGHRPCADVGTMTNEDIEWEIDWIRGDIALSSKELSERLAEDVKLMEEKEEEKKEIRANAEWERKWGVYYERA